MRVQAVVTIAVVSNNDADILESFLNEVYVIAKAEYEYFEILVVENGSVDISIDVVKKLQKTIPNIRLLVLSREYANEIAFTAALEHSVGDYVVLMDIECDPPAMIPEMVLMALNGSDIVVAERNDRSENGWLRNLFTRAFYSLFGYVSGFAILPNASDFRVLKRQAVNSLTRIRSKGRYLKHFHALVGFSQSYVPYTRIYRRAKPRSAQQSFFSLLWKAIDALISHSLIPLRFVTLLGFIASILNLLFILYVFIVSLVKRQVAEGWISTSLVNSTMFFFLFLILTILSEYIGRVLIESKDQPLYFIADEYQSNIMSAAKDKRNVV